jgi:serine/threonine protein kinase
MSPEQARAGDGVDHRSDLWSLAATAYRCVTGTTPYEGDMYAVIVQLAKSEPRPASRILPSLPAAVDDFFAAAFAKDPAARYQSARQLADAFDLATEDALARESGENEAGPQSVRSPLGSLTGETLVAPLAEMDAPLQEHLYLVTPSDPSIEQRPELDADGIPRYGPDRVSFDEVDARPSFFEAIEEGSGDRHTGDPNAAEPNGATTLDGGPVYRIFASCSQFPTAEDDEPAPTSSSRTVELRLGGKSPWSIYVDRESLPAPAPVPARRTRRLPKMSEKTFAMLCIIVFALIALAWAHPW